jgi:hypothetical protein
MESDLMPKRVEKKKSPRGAKKAFVDSMPEGMPAAEVVEKGREAGVELNAHQVSNIRWLGKHKAGKAQASLARHSSSPPRPVGPRARTRRTIVGNANRLSVANNAARLSTTQANAQNAHYAFRHIVMQIGLVAARALLDKMEDDSLGAPQ